MAKKLILTGRVQGVACRHYCSQYARKLHIRGSASNLRDGSVQVLLNTEEVSLINEYIHALKANPLGLTFWGRIEHIDVMDYSGTINGGDYVF